MIVAGVGGMGSAACWQLARRGKRVLGLERFDIPHAMGSSHGINRIIRLAYMEHPSYVPLLRRAYEVWRELEAAAGERLLFVTGGVDAGPEDGRIVQGALASCREHGLAHEVLTAAELAARFPGWRMPEHFAAVVQPDGGFVASERAIVAHAVACHGGGRRHPRPRADPFLGGHGRRHRERQDRRAVPTRRSGSCSRPAPGSPTSCRRSPATRFRSGRRWAGSGRRIPAHFRLGRFPVGLVDTDPGPLYVFPEWGVPGFKIGVYHHERETGDADALSREPTERDEAILREAIRAYFPDADGPVLALRCCLFTNTPDEHFVLDTLPGRAAGRRRLALLRPRLQVRERHGRGAGRLRDRQPLRLRPQPVPARPARGVTA